MGALNLVSVLGLGVFGLLAWLSGGCRRPIAWRTVAGSAGLMLACGGIVFLVPATRGLLRVVNQVVVATLEAGYRGVVFLFGPLALGPGQSTPSGDASIGFVLAAQVLPVLVFFAALMALLYYFGILQPVVRTFGRLFHRTLGLSGAESLAGAANIFVGLESAVTVRPYLERMTRSELLTLLTCGMSTIASTMLALYVLFLKDVFPQIAGHLVSASVVSIPAAALVSKLALPETGTPETAGGVPPIDPGDDAPTSALRALNDGAWDGLKLAAGVAALLIAVLGVVGIADAAMRAVTQPFAASLGGPIDLARLLGWAFTPLAWLLGIENADLLQAARLLGERLIVTEVVAYRELADFAAQGSVSPRTLLVLSYALCGFSHLASVGIFVGGISALAPSRRDDLAALGPRALVCATLATLMTGALAGALYHGQRGLL